MIFIARAVALLGLLVGQAALMSGDQPPPIPDSGPPEGYSLVWADEFEIPGLPDPTHWDYDTYRNKDGWWNDEAQYYSGPRLENARVENGMLVIESRREQLSPDEFPDWGGQNYTSARLVTRGRAEWTYGFIEVRAKLPCGRGTWPAIWTLGAPPNADWPDDGEIDLLEHVGYDPGVIHGTVHTAAHNHVVGDAPNYQLHLSDVCDTFHNYQANWTEDAISLGVDGRIYLTYPNDNAGENATWPFHRPQYLLLNVAIGGAWGGNEGIDDAIFPTRMEIDYVRVYQRRSDG